jgi:hypothetical protein
MDVGPVADHCVEAHFLDAHQLDTRCADPLAWIAGAGGSSADVVAAPRPREETDGTVVEYTYFPGQPVSVTRRTAP